MRVISPSAEFSLRTSCESGASGGARRGRPSAQRRDGVESDRCRFDRNLLVRRERLARLSRDGAKERILNGGVDARERLENRQAEEWRQRGAVSAFVTEGDPPLANLGRYIEQKSNEGAIAVRVEVHAPEPIMGGCIEPGRNKDQFGLEALKRGNNDSLESPHITPCPDPGGNGMLMVVPRPEPEPMSSTVPPGSAKRALMEGDGKDWRILPEDILRAIAVVNVVVHDCHTRQVAGLESMQGGNRHVIWEPKAHAELTRSVVARGTDQGVGIVHSPV